MADTRLFRITRERGKPEYGDRLVAGTKAGRGGDSWRKGRVVKVEATDAGATTGWHDVTAEFLGAESDRAPRGQLRR